MKQARKIYAVRLDKDKETREQITIMRMGRGPLKKIAQITGRNVCTITKEVGRVEHKKLIQFTPVLLLHTPKQPSFSWCSTEQFYLRHIRV